MDAYDLHGSRSVPWQTAKGTVSSSKNASTALSENPPTVSEIRDKPITRQQILEHNTDKQLRQTIILSKTSIICRLSHLNTHTTGYKP